MRTTVDIDEDVLRERGGVKDFDKYNVVPGSSPRSLDWDGLKDLMKEAKEKIS